MPELTCTDIADALGRRPRNTGAQVFRGVSTDSRTVEPGSLFVALKGEKFDGNDFVLEAFRKGAAGAVVSRVAPGVAECGGTLFVVDDTLRALGDIARAYRRRLRAGVIGVTGSNGKTTTKEMMFHILSKSARVARARKSFNNFIGVPLTILSIEPDDRFAVVEMGTNAPGEIAYLADIVVPDVGVITNVSATHLEGLGSEEGVMKAKGELLDRIAPDGTAVLNADNPWTMRLASSCKRRVLTFGETQTADFAGGDITQNCRGISFTIRGIRARVPAPGRHNAFNALAALAACSCFGLEIPQMVEALADFKLPAMRLETHAVAGFRIVNDAYNANPASVAAARDVLSTTETAGRRIFIFGDMLELGERSDELHKEIGRLVPKKNVDVFWTIGRQARLAGEAARDAGMTPDAVHHADSASAAADAVADFLREGDFALVKGSRGMALEEIIERVRQKRAGQQ